MIESVDDFVDTPEHQPEDRLFFIAAAAVLSGCFLLTIPALAGAVFDIADCSLRAEKREAEREARVAYEHHRRNEALLR